MKEILLIVILVISHLTTGHTQWTNETNTQHDGSAMIRKTFNPFWISRVLNQTGDLKGGLNFKVQGTQEAIMGYDHQIDGFYFGKQIADYAGSIVRIHGQTEGVSSTTPGVLRIGPKTSSHLIMDQNEIQSFTSDGPGGVLFINLVGGHVAMGGQGHITRLELRSNVNRIGFGTNNPESLVHFNGREEILRLDGLSPRVSFQTASSRHGSITYRDIGNELNFLSNNDVSTSLEVDGSSGLIITPEGHVGIGTETPREKLEVNGSVEITGEVTFVSDRRLKKSISNIDHATDLLAKLNPASYLYKAKEYPEMNLGSGQRYGLIAQEVTEVIPELVKSFSRLDIHEAHESYESINYIDLVSILIKSGQEQLEEINTIELQLKEFNQRTNILEQKKRK